RDRALEVGHAERDRLDRAHPCARRRRHSLGARRFRAETRAQREPAPGQPLRAGEPCREAAHTSASARAGRAAPSRSSRRAPTRSALAMIVSAGLTAELDTKNELSTTYRLSSSCALQSGSSAEVSGSSPKRTVPHWCATPASGIFLPRYRLPANH